jgi:hypothetical protein
LKKGEELWKQKRGPKNASLEQCDLGKGPGVVKGAFVELPRFFKDTGKVQDLESRLMTCMETLQGIQRQEEVKNPRLWPWRNRQRGGLATWMCRHRSPRACVSTCPRHRRKPKKTCTKWASACSSARWHRTTLPAPRATA